MNRIFGLPSHQEKTRTHGADMVRIIQPLQHLNGYKDFKTTVFDIQKETKWPDVCEKNDIIYFNYLHDPWGFAAMGATARAKGVKMVMDMDDDIWGIHKDNPAYEAWKPGGEKIKNFTAICNEVDFITCTNDYLKHVIMNNTNKTADRIKVIPNYIDLKLYKYSVPFKDDGKIQLTHFGSTTHFFDLEETQFVRGVDRIMKEYPNVTLKTVGAWKPELRKKWGRRYEQGYGHQDVYTWISEFFPKLMAETDILVCPLTSDIYNRCKSNIKWQEAGSAKIPGVFQDIRQYSECVDGTNGMIAGTDSEWYKRIKYLIDNPHARQRMGEVAFRDIKEKWDIDKHLDEYTSFFKEVLDSPLKKL
jgi:glycosyltransferase involved in cell wall biosynthesis